MSMLDELPWAGDLLDNPSLRMGRVRVRVLANTYNGDGDADEDVGKLGWARYTRGGVTVWVELDDGTATHFQVEDLEVIE